MMRFMKAEEEREKAINVNCQVLEQVRDFRYLGQNITYDGRCDKPSQK